MLHATLSGNIGGEPELKYTADGKPILRINVAHNYRERDQQGEYVDRVEWLRVTLMGARAESLQNILKKGQKVTALGTIKARPWTDQQGNIRAGLEMLANEIEIMSPRESGDHAERPSGQAARPRQQTAANGAGGLKSVPDDQLPF